MAKKGFVLDNIPNVVSSSSATGKNGWSLCIGAGVSMPIFPDWYTLAAELANEFSTDKTVKREDMQKLEFSPDALIQMVKNTTSISDHDFSIKMSQILYENLKTKIDPDEWNSIIEILEANHLSSCTAETWEVFKKYRETLFASTTPYGLAKVILKSIDNNLSVG